MSSFLPWHTLHVSVRDGLPDLEARTDAGGLFVVCWCDDVPVGQLSIPAANLPLTGSQLASMVAPVIAPAVANRLLRHADATPQVAGMKQVPEPPLPLGSVLELNRPLQRLSERNASADGLAPREVSVVVCTRNRPASLQACLASLIGLIPPPLEIVVVDNAPGTEVTRRVVARFPGIRYVAEPRPGLSAARNTGIRSARGSVIAFTDDDVRVHPSWIRKTLIGFADPSVIAVTGLVLPAELATPAQYVFQSSEFWDTGYRPLVFDQHFFRITRHLGVPAWRLGAGANMAFRREAFEAVGDFDERLGAGASGCSEDSELWYRLLAEGHRCRYEPSSVVFHVHQSDWAGLRRQMHSYMRGHVAALFVQFARYGHWGNLYRAFFALPAYLARLASNAMKRRIGRALYHSGSPFPAQPVAPQIRGAMAGYRHVLRYSARRKTAPTQVNWRVESGNDVGQASTS